MEMFKPDYCTVGRREDVLADTLMLTEYHCSAPLRMITVTQHAHQTDLRAADAVS